MKPSAMPIKVSPAAPPGALILTLIMGTAVVSASSGSIFIRLAAAPALAVAAYRLVWATLLFVPPFLVPARAKASPIRELGALGSRDVLVLGLSGTALALHFALWITSLSHTSVASSVLLVDTAPFFIGVAGRWFFGRKSGRFFWTGLSAAFLGCIVIFWSDLAQSQNSLQGNLLALGGAAAFAVYLLVGSRARQRLSLLAYVWPVYATAAAVLVAACILTGTPLRGFSFPTYAYLFLLGLVPQCIGHTSYNWSLRWLNPALVALINLAEPVGASFLAYLILGESVTSAKLLGGGTVLLGIWLATRPEGGEGKDPPGRPDRKRI